MKDKLNNFGPIYVINLARRTDRREALIKSFQDFEVTDYHFIEAVDAEQENLYERVHQTSYKRTKYVELACTLSHFEAIRFWLDHGDSEYALIMEDDLSFETVQYWNFSWEDFMKSIDFKYNIIQLQIGRMRNINTELHIRDYFDQCTGLYLIHRDYAKALVNKHFIDGKYDFPDFAVADYFIYDGPDVYSIPLFVVNELSYKSDINPSLRYFQTISRNQVLKYWKKLTPS
jgi:GR25 family glycosyltransferase involved in LPS biosynthesis